MTTLKVGEYVFQKDNGVCYIEEKAKMTMVEGFPEKTYFVLRPRIDERTKIFIAEAPEYKGIRELMSKKKAVELLQNIAKIKPVRMSSDKNERERAYKEAIDSNEPAALMGVIKALQAHNIRREEEGKKTTAMDERYGRLVQKTLFSEFCFLFSIDILKVQELVTVLTTTRKKVDLKDYGIKTSGTGEKASAGKKTPEKAEKAQAGKTAQKKPATKKAEPAKSAKTKKAK